MAGISITYLYSNDCGASIGKKVLREGMIKIGDMVVERAGGGGGRGDSRARKYINDSFGRKIIIII